jgi:hypothetical protein
MFVCYRALSADPRAPELDRDTGMSGLERLADIPLRRYKPVQNPQDQQRSRDRNSTLGEDRRGSAQPKVLKLLTQSCPEEYDWDKGDGKPPLPSEPCHDALSLFDAMSAIGRLC